MLAQLLLPDTDHLDLNDVTFSDSIITVAASSSRTSATCPDCQQPSSREHSHYWRRPVDLPCAERQMRLCLLVRRFFCDNTMCERKTFAEQFPDIIVPYARRTNRLAAKQRQTGLELGGEVGARALTKMAMPISGDTVLRLVRNTPSQAIPTPRVLGIDDWAAKVNAMEPFWSIWNVIVRLTCYRTALLNLSPPGFERIPVSRSSAATEPMNIAKALTKVLLMQHR